MFKHKPKNEAKVCVEPFDDTGEIQVVPIDTVVGSDAGCDLEADDPGRNQSLGCGIRGSGSRETRICSVQRWREPDIVA